MSVADVPRTVKSDPSAWTAEGASTIACPECYATMQAIVLHGVHLDRCPQHGVWFDIGEITEVLRTTGKLDTNEVAREDGPSTAQKAGGAAAGVGVAILEVVGTVLDTVSDVVS